MSRAHQIIRDLEEEYGFKLDSNYEAGSNSLCGDTGCMEECECWDSWEGGLRGWFEKEAREAEYRQEVKNQERGKELTLFVKDLATNSRFAYTMTLTNPNDEGYAETLVGFRDRLSVRFYKEGKLVKIFQLRSVGHVAEYLINAVARGYDFREGGEHMRK